jgi:hypothetical protein
MVERNSLRVGEELDVLFFIFGCFPKKYSFVKFIQGTVLKKVEPLYVLW